MAAKKAKAAKRRTTAARSVSATQAPPPVAASEPSVRFPVRVHVLKGGDRIPVQVVDQGHLDRLRSEHGNGAIEMTGVQS